jgi:hypothetical protein
VGGVTFLSCESLLDDLDFEDLFSEEKIKAAAEAEAETKAMAVEKAAALKLAAAESAGESTAELKSPKKIGRGRVKRSKTSENVKTAAVNLNPTP